MISYDNYKNRILKLAKAKRILHKFRFLIGGALAVIIAGSVGLMVAKGAYLSDMSLPAQVAFGEEYEPTMANAFLASKSSQRVEYSPADGGEWTTRKPVKAGTYRARTVSPKLVGYSYSNVVEFEITKLDAQFAITGSKMVYGNVPDCNVSGLLAGHSVAYDELVFTYTPYASVSKIEVEPSSFRITDASGEDYTDCYNVELIGKEGVQVSKRNISVKPQISTYIYNGAAQSYVSAVDDTTRSRLANGDEIVVETNVNEVKDAGDYTVNITGYKIMHGETDVTAMYEASRLTSVLTVRQREAAFNLEGGSKVYDGRPLTSGALTAENLVEGHTAQIKGGIPYITDVDGRPFTPRYDVAIFDAAGNDVTDNYARSCKAGSLQILPCEIKYSTKDMEWEYDGDAHDYLHFDLLTQISGFTFSAVSLGTQSEITDFGTKPNAIGLIATDAYGDDVTRNFKFIPAYGTLKINRRKITVTTGNLDETFNGEEQWTGDGEVTSGTLVYGHDIGADYAKICTIKDVGTKSNTTEFAVYDYFGRPVTNNYEIKYVNGTLEISPVHIIITTASALKDYNGTPLSDRGYITDLNPFGSELYNGDKLILVGEAAEITNAGNTSNKNTFRVPNGNYVIDEDKSHYGTLTVLPRRVEVKIDNESLVYGENIPDGVYNKSVELVNDETLTFTTHLENALDAPVEPETWQGYTLLNVNYYEIVANADAKITGGNALLSNYDLVFISGTLEITAREIVVITESASKEYDGSPLQNTAYDTAWANDRTKAGLLGKDINTLIPAKETTTLLEVYSCANSNEYIAPNANYRVVDHEFGTLTITKRPIMITTADASKTYDGTPLSKTDVTVNYAVFDQATGMWKADSAKQGLIDGDELIPVGSSAEITDAGSIRNICEYTHVNSYGSSNYDIHYNYGTLTVEKRTIELQLPLNDYRVQYGIFTGTSFKVSGGFRTSDGEILTLPAGQTLTVWLRFVALAGVPEVGKHTVEAFKYEIGDDEGDGNSLKNYIITCPDVEIEIYAAPLSIKVDDVTIAYGDELPENTFELTAGELYFGETIKLEYTYDREVKGIGEYGFTVTGVKVYDKYGNLKKNGDKNYDFTFTDGTLNILQRAITIKTADGNKQYDGKPLEKPNPILSCIGEDGIWKTPLADGDKVKAVFVRSITDASRVTNDNEYVIVDANGDDVTENYSVEYVYGELYISRKSASLYMYNDLHSERIDYGEGENWSYPSGKGNYRSVRGLVEGEEIELFVKVSLGEVEVEYPKNAGQYYVKPDFEKTLFYRADGTVNPNGVNNYDFNPLLYGKLEVLGKDITVTIENDTVVYGETAEGKTFEYSVTKGLDAEGKLPYGDTLTIESFAYKRGYDKVTPKDVGKYSVVGDKVLVNGEEAGAHNYYITYEGTLTVEKKVLNIRPAFPGYSITYGNYIGCYSMSTDGQSYFESVENGEELLLPYGEDLSVSWCIEGVGEDEAAPVKDGGHVLSAHLFYITGDNGLLDEGDGEHLKNYIITCGDSHLTVNPLTVHVDVKDESIEYGDPLPEAYEYEYNDKYTSFYPEGFHLKQLGVSMEFEFGFDEEVKNVGEYPYVVTGVKVFDKNGALKEGDGKNYTFVCHGALTVKPKKISISLEDKSLPYGETVPTSGNDYKIMENGVPVLNGTLANGETLKVSVIYYMLDGVKTTPRGVGKYKVVAEGYTVYKDGSEIENGLDNYEIKCENGTLEITKKTVTVVLGDIAPVRYGETFTYAAGVDNFANFNEIELAYGERLEVAVEYLTDGVVGTPKNANIILKNNYSARLKASACTVYESDGETVIEDGADNYNFVCDDVEDLTINLRRVSVQVLDLDDVQYGGSIIYPDRIGNHGLLRDTETNEDLTGNLPYGDQLKLDEVSYYVEVSHNNFVSVTNPVDVGVYVIRSRQSVTTVYESDGITEGSKYNYDLRFVNGRVEIVPREITIYLRDYEMEYGEFYIENEGGTFQYPETKNNYDVGNSDPLVYGQMLEIGFSHGIKYQKVKGGEFVTPKDVGTYIITFEKDDYIIYDGYETYWDGSYDITFIPGTLTITEKFVSVRIDDASCTYGDELPENSYKIYGSAGSRIILPYGDEFTVLGYEYLQNGVVVTPRNAGSYQITVKDFAITNVTDDISHNYTVIIGWCNLTIKKADLKLQLSTVRSAYYGDYRGYPSGIGNFNKDKTRGIQYNDNFELAVEYEVKEDYRNHGLVTVGEKSKEIPVNAALYSINLVASDSVIHTTEGEQFDLELNYNVEWKNVTFKINHRTVYVYYTLPEYTYGETVEKPEYIIEVSTFDIDQSEISKTELPYNEGMPDFEYEYEDEYGNVYDTPVNAGKYIVSDVVKGYVKGSEALAKNYLFIIRGDDLIINKKAVEISFTDMEIEYGDYVEKNESGVYEYTLIDWFDAPYTVGANGGLEYGETLQVWFNFRQNGEWAWYKQVGDYDREVFKLKIDATGGDSEEHLVDGETFTDKFANYEFTVSAGILKVTPKAVTVEINDNSCFYGDDISALTNSYKDLGELPFGDKIIPDYEYDPAEVVSAGEYAITAETYTVERNGKAVLNGNENYKIKFVDGTLTVKKIALTVTVGDYAVVYGEELPEIEYVVTGADGEAITLPYGETLGVTFAYEYGGRTFTAPQNAYIYNIVKASAEISGGNGNLDNYEIEYDLGTLTIDPKPVTVTVESNSCTYGEDLPDINYTVAEELHYGDTLKLTFTFSGEATVKNAGTYAIAVAQKEIIGGNGRVENYDISYTENSPVLTINRKAISVNLNGGVNNPEFEYGDDYDASIRTVTVDGMEYGERIVVAVNYSALNRAAARVERLNVGNYVGVLDWDNCKIYSGYAEKLGGLSNYELSDEFAVPTLQFSIVPKIIHVTVESDSCVYGDDLPAIGYSVAETMPEGERLLLTFEFEAENQNEVKNVDTYDILVESEEIANGDYANYDIRYEDNSPKLEITARKIAFGLKKVKKIFGETVSYPAGIENYESVTNEAYEELFEVTVKFFKNGSEIENPTDAGLYDIVLDGITAYNSDRTLILNGDKNYTFDETAIEGGLEITGSAIRIKTGDGKKIYDGEALSYNDYDFDTLDFIVAGTLADGYTVKIEKLFEQTDATEEEGVENKTEFAVYYNGKISANYEVEYDYGTLTVEPRPVNVTTFDATEDYSGDPLTAGYKLEYGGDDNTLPAIVDGHTEKANHAEQINAGSRPNVITFTVKDAAGNDVTANYAFTTVKTGTLTVTPKAVTVTINPVDAIYGEEIGSEGFELDCGESLPDGKALSFSVIYTQGENTVDGTLLDCGAYTIKADTDSVRVDGEETDNYDFDFVDGTLTVNKRGIIVITDDKEKLYDGTPLYLGGYVTKFVGDESKDGLLNGDELVTLDSELTDAALGITDKGTKSNAFTFSVPADGNYYVVEDETVYGTLEILVRRVLIITASDEKEYDGQPFEAAEEEDYYALDNDGNPVPALMSGLGHTVEVSKRFIITNATAGGGVDNAVEYVIVDGSGDSGVSQNYAIEYDYGTLKITKRALTVTLNTAGEKEFEYGDGTVASQIESFTADRLVEGEELEIAVDYKRNGVAVSAPKNAGDYVASLGAGSKVSNGTELENSIGNYDITCKPVSFTINCKQVTLNMGDWASEVYDGQPHEFTNHTLSDGGWAEYGDKLLTVAFEYYTDEAKQHAVASPVDAGTYYVYLNADNTVISGGVALSDNYDVTCEHVTFTVEKREIVIKLSDVESVYDGTGYDFTTAEDGFTVENLCGDDEVERTVIYTDNKTGYDIQSPVKAGTYTITFDTTKFDMSNYAIAESGNEFSCTLTIKRRGLNVQVADRTVEVGDDDEYTADDLTCDFVEGDLENAGVAFNRTENATKPDGAVAEYSVTVSFTNDEVMDNYEIVTNKSGTLTIVHRWVIVKPEYVGENEFVYNGEPVGESNFDIDHKHKSDGAKGFDEEHLGMISKAYTFVNIENDRDIYTNGAFPVDAGTYEVSVVLTGKDGFVIGDNYYVEYETARFTIVKRKVTLATENDAANGGLTEFVYSNEEPDFKAVMTENTAGYGEDDGMIGGLPEATFKLYIDDAEAKSFNVGTYEVRASFDGEDNYEISWNPYTVKIVKRNLVFAPVNNYSQPQKYNGKDLTVGSEDYALLQDTELANGDKLYITATSLEPTKIMGSVTISSARVVNALDENDDKSGNYNLVYKYTAGDPLLAGLRRSTFSAMLEYEQFTVLYDQLADGGEYPFTGSSFKHKFDKNNAVEILDDEDYDGIYPAHTFSLTAGEVTVAADAGTYTDWLTTGRVFKVTDNNGRNVTALYSFVCNNATDENKPITVTKYVVEVTLNGVSADKLHVGEDGVLTAENGVNKLNAANYEVDGLISGHSAEIYAFDTDDGKLLAISLYGSLKSGAKYDVAVNYECTAVAPIDGVRIEYMTLEEIAELSKPAVNVAIDGEIVNAEALANGLGTLFTPSEIDGSWVLKSGVTVTGLLTDHFADVIVFNENGGYALGVVVYRVNASNRRIDVSANYKLKLPEQVGGVPVRQVGTDEIVDLKRDLVIDLSGFAYESDGKIADGSFTVSGLNTGDGHVAEVYVTATGGGSYEVTVLVFKYRKVGSKEQRTDRREVYEVKYVLPEGVELTVSTADVGTIYD